MNIETLFQKLETDYGYTNTEYFNTRDIDLIKQILNVVNTEHTKIVDEMIDLYQDHYTTRKVLIELKEKLMN